MSLPSHAALTEGDAIPTLRVTLTRAELVRYAGASGDFNPIHWSDRVAHAVGLPGVVAHGMLTMAVAGRAVTEWVGDPGAVVDYGVRFTKPVVVPDDDAGATVEITGIVAVKLDDDRARIDLTVSEISDPGAPIKVLAAARATVQLAP